MRSEWVPLDGTAARLGHVRPAPSTAQVQQGSPGGAPNLTPAGEAATPRPRPRPLPQPPRPQVAAPGAGAAASPAPPPSCPPLTPPVSPSPPKEEVDEYVKLSPEEQHKRLKSIIQKIDLDSDGFLTESKGVPHG